MTRWQMLGIFLGFVGVLVLIIGQGRLISRHHDGHPGLMATLSYAVSASYTKRCLKGVPAMVTSALSLVMAAVILLALFAWQNWPTGPVSCCPGGMQWPFECSVLPSAYLLFFGLIERAGAKSRDSDLPDPGFCRCVGVDVSGKFLLYPCWRAVR